MGRTAGLLSLAGLWSALALAGCSRSLSPTPANSLAQADLPPDQCPAIGTATSPVGQALNALKNRAVAPTDAQINPAVTLAAMLADGDDTGRFDQARPRRSRDTSPRSSRAATRKAPIAET